MAEWSHFCSQALARPRTLWYRVDTPYSSTRVAPYRLKLTIFQGSACRLAMTTNTTRPATASKVPIRWVLLLRRSPGYIVCGAC